jgi:diphosphomevalonate decarboxylase
LKYHGLADFDLRTAYFSSISINNDSAFTITYVKFNQKFDNDQFILNGIRMEPDSSEFQRVFHQLEYIRKHAEITTHATVISRNISKKTNNTAIGKGLGFSASAGAAIAKAAISILYEQSSEYTQNSRLNSIFSRYMAGSATRSAVGGISLWLNHPKIDDLDSYAVQLNREKDDSFMQNISLITIPISSKVRTDQAHKIAIKSIFYPSWLENRQKYLIQLIEAINQHNFQTIGELAEYDTMCLHAVTMTSELKNSLIIWTPETLSIMHLIQKIRSNGIPVYFSIDTGPSVVLITQRQFTDQIITALNTLSFTNNMDLEIGGIGGESEILDKDHEYCSFIKGDIEKYGG